MGQALAPTLARHRETCRRGAMIPYFRAPFPPRLLSDCSRALLSGFGGRIQLYTTCAELSPFMRSGAAFPWLAFSAGWATGPPQ
jgi:hypothetical protein